MKKPVWIVTSEMYEMTIHLRKKDAKEAVGDLQLLADAGRIQVFKGVLQYEA